MFVYTDETTDIHDTVEEYLRQVNDIVVTVNTEWGWFLNWVFVS